MDDTQLFKLMLHHLTFFLDVTKRCGFLSQELKDPMTQCLGIPRLQESWIREGGSVADVEMFGLCCMNLRILRCLVRCAPLIVEGKGFVPTTSLFAEFLPVTLGPRKKAGM